MAATTLNSVTLADPYAFTVTRSMIGGMKEAANGTKHLDYASTTMKCKIKVQWRLITEAQRTTIVTQAQNAISASRTLALSDGKSFTVWFDPEAAPTETIVNSGSGYLYNIEVSFLEA